MTWRTFCYSPRHVTAAFVAVGWIDHGPCPAHHGVWSDNAYNNGHQFYEFLSEWIEWPHADKPPVYPRRES